VGGKYFYARISALVIGADTGFTGAGDGIRTRDINLGKVALYQLSYSRVIPINIFTCVCSKVNSSLCNIGTLEREGMKKGGPGRRNWPFRCIVNSSLR
jgi:hypothetical protein